MRNFKMFGAQVLELAFSGPISKALSWFIYCVRDPMLFTLIRAQLFKASLALQSR